MHSAEYRNGAPYTDQDVLVVGFGNSGGEIAIDLVEHGARARLSVRSPVNVIPRELFGIPILAVGKLQRRLPPRIADAINAPLLRAVIGDLTAYGLRKLPYGPSTQIRVHCRIPLIGIANGITWSGPCRKRLVIARRQSPFWGIQVDIRSAADLRQRPQL